MEVTTIGGGTGTTVVLTALKKYKDIHLNAIVSMMDDGGSNAIVRDQFGLLPLSDLRKAIIALSASNNSNQIIRNLFNYRFSQGDGISGHTLGNLIMIALSDITGSEVGALKASEKIFNTAGDIIPVTLDKVRLVAKYTDGKELVGEHRIDTMSYNGKIKEIRLSNKAQATQEAIDAIKKSKFITIGPGDLYTSIIPNILVDGIAQALRKTKGEIIVITNLMTKQGETHWMKISDFVHELEKYIGRRADHILINNKEISKQTLKHYTTEQQKPFEDDMPKKSKRIIRTDVISENIIEKEKGDNLPRSIIRHDTDKLGTELYSLFRRDFFSILSKIMPNLTVTKE